MEIRRADEADEAQVLALARRTLGWDDDPRFVDLYRWKHDANPFGRSPRWVAVEGRTVVGFRVFLRWRFRHPDGTTVEAVRAVDTATHPDHQGKGIFTRLTLGALDALVEEGVGFVFNTPNDKSRPGYLKMGWVELGRPGVAIVARPGGLVRSIRSRTAAALWSEPCELGVPAADLLGEADVATRDPSRTTTDATPDVLRWRYGLASLRYRAVTLGRDPAEGLVVFRLRRRGTSLEAAIGEIAAPTAAARRALLRRVRAGSGADHLLVVTDTPVDATPAVQVSSLAPVVTWRAVAQQTPPQLDDLGFTVGDLELF